MVGPATGKARPPTVDSFTGGTSRRSIGPSRAEGTSTRQIGDTNQLTQDMLRSNSKSMENQAVNPEEEKERL